MGMGRNSFVAKRGTICRRSGNHLGTTFIRAHLELKLGEGKRHPFPLFALLTNMLIPTTVRSKARFWIVSLSWTHTFPSRSRSEMQDHVCPGRDSILRAIFKLVFIRRGSLTTRRAISIHAPDQSPCSIFTLTDNSEIFASHSLRMARLSFSGNSSVTRMTSASTS